jgi:putative FmdB family regulatory protein
MPYYDYNCQACSLKGEFLTHIDENQICPRCHRPMKRLLHSQFGINMGAAGAHGYYDENLGTYINTNKQRKEEMKKQGVSEKIGKGWY